MASFLSFVEMLKTYMGLNFCEVFHCKSIGGRVEMSNDHWPFPSSHKTFTQRRVNADATSQRRIGVDTT